VAKADGVFIYLGTYPDEAAARADYDVVKDLHALGAVGTYDGPERATVAGGAAVPTPDCRQGREYVRHPEIVLG
jgi:hypothetical protein